MKDEENLFDYPCSPTFRGYELEMMYGDVRASEMMPMGRHQIENEPLRTVNITQPSINVLRELKRIDTDLQGHLKTHYDKKSTNKYLYK